MNATTVREPTEFPNSREEELRSFFVIEKVDTELETSQLPQHSDWGMYGVGVECPFRDELPEWAQTAIALLDIVSQKPSDTVPGIGYKGTKYYEFIGPKHEDC